MVEPLFRCDWKPRSGVKIEQASQLLDWTPGDLLGPIGDLSQEERSRRRNAARGEINGSLNHVAGAEWWHQERIGHTSPSDEADLPSDPLDRLELQRGNLVHLLPTLEGLNQVVGRRGLGSPRKVLRRAPWRERDRTGHIRKLT
jgi:hypothetical protein